MCYLLSVNYLFVSWGRWGASPLENSFGGSFSRSVSHSPGACASALLGKSSSSGGAATRLTHGLYPDHPPLTRPQKPLLKMAPPHPAPCWAESGSKRASCACSLPGSPCSGATTELADVREATTAQQTNVGPGQLCPGRQLWLSPPLSRPQQAKAQVSQLPPTLGAASLSKSPGGTSVM